MAPPVGLEPTTPRLTAACSTIELRRNIKSGLAWPTRPLIVLALPIFPGRRQPSIVGAGELNCRVRNGNGWTLTAINTNYSILTDSSVKIPLYYSTLILSCQETFGDPYRIRTDVKGVRGLCLNHLTNGPFRCSYPFQTAHHLKRSGTPSGTRTLDTLIKSQVLYQLS